MCRKRASIRFIFVLSLLVCAGAPLGALTVVRGDADGNGSTEITDAIFVLSFLFTGGIDPVCIPAGDSNGDRDLNLTDPIFLLNHLFLGGPVPPPLEPDEVSACVGGPDPSAVARGIVEFESADAEGNLYSCTLCHSMAQESGAEVIRAGYTLLDSLARPNYKQGGRASFVGAVNVCRQDWMAIFDAESGNYVPWTEETPRFKDLVAFIESRSTAPSSPALVYEIVAPRTGPVAGDANRGCTLFDRSCSVCHGLNGAGTDLAPPVLDVTPLCQTQPDLCLNVFCESDPETCLDNPEYLRRRIRLSGPRSDPPVYHVPAGFELDGSTMPFWTKDKLSDDQAEDIVAYILEARRMMRESQGTIDCVAAPSPDGNALRRGTLTGALHGVSGTAEDLDTRRIRFSGFSYDGGGIEVRVWLSNGVGSPGGRAIGPDLFGRILKNETLVVELPPGVASGSYDSVSIRCVATGRDFAGAKLDPVP